MASTTRSLACGDISGCRLRGETLRPKLLMISVWENLDALKNMTGEDWESEVIPDEREAERIEECFVHHYTSIS